MAKAFRYQHFRSLVADKVPSAEEIREGEIAVNLAAGKEKMFLKNTDNVVIKFITEEQVDAKIASGSSGPVDDKIEALSGAIDTNTASISDLNDKVAALAMKIDVTLSISPSVIYKAVATNITLTGRMVNGTPTEMRLMDGNTVLATSATSPITKTVSGLNITANSKSYKVVGTSLGMVFPKEASLSARYPIYYGFATSASALAVNANRYNPTTSAEHTYEKTNDLGARLHFYLLVPPDITAPKEEDFTMNKSPFVVIKSNETINGLNYNVYTSGADYESGTKLTINVKGEE